MSRSCPTTSTSCTPKGLAIATVPALRDRWLSAIDHEQPALFVVDLGAVAYLVGTALSAVRKRQREYSGDMIVTNASARLARLFRLTGPDEVIEVNGQDGHADEAELLDGRRNGRLDGSGSTVQ